jgi:hypothetical protein
MMIRTNGPQRDALRTLYETHGPSQSYQEWRAQIKGIMTSAGTYLIEISGRRYAIDREGFISQFTSYAKIFTRIA